MLYARDQKNTFIAKFYNLIVESNLYFHSIRLDQISLCDYYMYFFGILMFFNNDCF